MGALDNLVALARCQRMAVVDYKKPFDAEVTRRIVEPYQLLYSGENLMALCWQIDPEVTDRQCWRHFRIDRIASVYDSQREFRPRADITIGSGYMEQYEFREDQ